MLKLIKASYKNIIQSKYNDNPWTNVYGISRSLLALSLLVTLVFSGKDTLFPTINDILVNQTSFVFEDISIFFMLKKNLTIAYYISIFILILVISGYLPQITGILHWWISYSYFTSGIIIEGGDQIIMILTLFIIPISLTDNRLNHWFKEKKSNRSYIKLFIWSIYWVILVQISIIYFHSAISKFGVDEWLNGTATYYWFTHNTFGFPTNFRAFIANLMSNSFIVIASTWGAILLEIFLFGWVFMKRNSINWKLMFILAILFHFIIACNFGLFSFWITMSGALVLYFFPKNKNFKLKINFHVHNR